MFARSAFRAAQNLNQPVRRYASESSAKTAFKNYKPNSNFYAGSTAGAVGLAYLLFREYFPSTKTGAAPAAITADAAPKAFTGGDQGFISLKLDSVENYNHNTKKFRFSLPDANYVSGLNIASALITKYKGPQDEKPVIRPYTPTSDEDARGYIDFVIKKYEGGAMSTHLHNMSPGQRLELKGPIPKYPWEPNKHPSIAMVAGGTGITPMYQVARAIFSNPEDKTKVTLVFANVTEGDILLKSELQELENTYPNRFRAFYLLDKPPDSWKQGSGHVTQELLKTILPFEPKDKDGKIFVCGPPGMYKAVSGMKKSPQDQGELSGILKEMGYTEDQVYKF
ncbi:NADH-cytochrome b5 reductase [Bacidia gigantensis]|uniref:NADH-cytochrome b5 reductase n=1 Tax=Bacidia gigantensis TaxID=2732470 RepID=UPI001D03D5EB|nr:NADH-cytochrome b5 reductase [Bacidia gigantensis]KAG8533949.1 NADH-cytochrome b5 reductase [Bacidia gigantensis]